MCTLRCPTKRRGQPPSNTIGRNRPMIARRCSQPLMTASVWTDTMQKAVLGMVVRLVADTCKTHNDLHWPGLHAIILATL